MSKRFADTDKYKKPFLRSLKGPYKLLWDYICLDCNHAGMWQVDFQIAQIYLGADMLVNEADALAAFNADEERIVLLNGGKKWLIKPFIDFQYGELKPANRVHASVLSELEREGFCYDPSKGLIRSIHGPMDMDKDKDKDKKEGGAGETKKRFVLPEWVDPEAWAAFEELRKKLRKPLTDTARKLNVDRLDALRKAGNDPKAVIYRSIEKGWQGFFPLKDELVQKQPQDFSDSNW